MTYVRGLRWSTAWAFLPLIVAAGFAAAVSERDFFGDYPLVATSQAWVALVVVVPLLAGWGAWDAARLGPWLDATMAGAHRAKAFSRVLALGPGLAAAGVIAVVVAAAGFPRDIPAWGVSVAAVMTMVAATMFGVGLGTVVPRLAAVPLAVLAGYGCMAVAVADPSSRIGRVVLPGVVAPCCASTDQISLRSLLTAVVAAALVAMSAALTLVVPGGRALRAGVLCLSLVVSSGLGWLATLGTQARGQIVPRTTSVVCQEQDAVRYCVWPEHAASLDAVARTGAQAIDAARTLGMNLPSSWSEKAQSRTVTFMWASGASNFEHQYAMGLDIAHWAGCTSPEEEADVASLVALTMGATPAQLKQRDPSLATSVDDIERAGEDGRKRMAEQRVEACQQ